MSWAPTVFVGFHSVQTLMHLIENISPQHNIGLKGKDLAAKLPGLYRHRLEHLEKIKGEVCRLAQISPAHIQIRIQDRGIIENHGNGSQAVLAVSLPLLAGYEPFQQETLDTPLERKERITYRKFLDRVPDHPDDIYAFCENLSPTMLKEHCYLAEKFLLDLSDDEVRFIMSHEILGHAQSYDSLTIGFFSTLLGWGSYYLGEVCHTSGHLSSFRYAWHSIFYALSRVALQSIIVRRLEIRADQKALMEKSNVKGGQRFFKRLMILNALKKLSNSKNKNLLFQWLSNKEGESLFNLGEESLRSRLLRCWHMQQGRSVI